MQHKIKLFVIASVAIVLCSTNVSAETTATQLPCKTEVECTKLSDALQAQIDVLEAKGIENLTEKEFNKLDALSDELLAAAKVETAIAKAKTAEAKAKTAEAKVKTAEAKVKTQAMYDELQETVKRIETTLKK